MRSSMGNQPSREIPRGSPELGSEDSSGDDDHPMKALLDDGGLTTNCRDRDFTNFLDLKNEYHTEFINRLKECVQTYGHLWKELRDSTDERRKCAQRFTEDNGMRYWGTPVNRKKYLSPEGLSKIDHVCQWPEHEEEIVRTLMILLERKAKSACKSDEKQDDEAITGKHACDSISTSIRKDSSDAPAANVTVRHGKKREERKKRRRRTQTDSSSEDEKEAPKVVVNGPKETTNTANTTKTPRDKANRSTSTPHSIRPFGSIEDMGADSARSKSAKRSKTTPANPETDANESPLPTTLPGAMSRLPRTLPETMVTPQRRIEQEEAQYEKYAMFHVSASNQQMAPVWVPFGKFESSSAFLEHMWDECKLSQVEPIAQPNQLASNWQNNSTPMQWVVAASVKFEWSGLEIRVRRGYDRDLNYIREELEKAWYTKEENPTGPETFRIFVMLHIVG